ncbi:MAG: hypothetical protein ABSF17_01475 [Terracidiphilus sp.]
MKRSLCLLLACSLVAPLWAAKKTTVQELKDTLAALNQEKKTDEEVATRLKDIDLGEELTSATLKLLAPLIPGPLSQEQMNILEGRSALLSPPASDLPTSPAPDAAMQKAILTRATDYANKVYAQNPRFMVKKVTARYQDGVQGIRTNSGMTSNVGQADRAWELPSMYMRFYGSHLDEVETDHGVEKRPVEKTKVPWGQNGQVSEGGPGPNLSVILQQAEDSGKLSWLRWESIAGKPFAVFSFAIDKKKSNYVVNYCCFPVTGDTGRMGYEGTGANFQTATDWKDFKATVSYRGELFIDPDTGVIVRLITQAGLKPTDFVHQEDMRIDYAPLVIDGRERMLPADSFTITEVVPNGDNYAARYSIRHTVFVATYQDYQLADSVNPGKIAGPGFGSQILQRAVCAT